MSDGDPFLGDDGQPAVCAGCGKPVLKGQARYTLGEFRDPPEYRHYECTAKAKFEEANRRVEDSLNRLRAEISRMRRGK